MNGKSALIAAIITALLVIAVNAQQSDREIGVSLYREGKFDQAVDRLRAATTMDQKDQVAWMYLGASYVHLHKYSDAQKAFSKTNVVPINSDPFDDSPGKITYKPRAPRNDTIRREYPIGFGVIRVAVELLPNGKVGFAFPLRNSVREWEPEVIAAAKGIRFQPAIKGGVPVTVITIV